MALVMGYLITSCVNCQLRPYHFEPLCVSQSFSVKWGPIQVNGKEFILKVK